MTDTPDVTAPQPTQVVKAGPTTKTLYHESTQISSFYLRGDLHFLVSDLFRVPSLPNRGLTEAYRAYPTEVAFEQREKFVECAVSLKALHSHIDLKEHPQARAFFKWADAYDWSVKKEIAP